MRARSARLIVRATRPHARAACFVAPRVQARNVLREVVKAAEVVVGEELPARPPPVALPGLVGAADPHAARPLLNRADAVVVAVAVRVGDGVVDASGLWVAVCTLEAAQLVAHLLLVRFGQDLGKAEALALTDPLGIRPCAVRPAHVDRQDVGELRVVDRHVMSLLRESRVPVK